jgi:hypothetical protein
MYISTFHIFHIINKHQRLPPIQSTYNPKLISQINNLRALDHSQKVLLSGNTLGKSSVVAHGLSNLFVLGSRDGQRLLLDEPRNSLRARRGGEGSGVGEDISNLLDDGPKNN